MEEKQDCNNNKIMEQKLEELEGRVQMEAERRAEDELNGEVERMRRLIEIQDRRERKNNVVIRGLMVSKERVKEQVERFFRETLSVRGDIIWTKIAGLQGREVIIAGLKNWEDKQEVMKNKCKLRGSKIFINHDYTKAERDIQSKIVEAAREERKKGRAVKVGYKKIMVDGKWIDWTDGAKERANNRQAQVFQ